MTAGDPSSSWRTLLMETLAPEGEPTLLASDGAPREWAGLPRMSGNRLLAEKIRSVVARVHESRTVVDVVVGPRRTSTCGLSAHRSSDPQKGCMPSTLEWVTRTSSHHGRGRRRRSGGLQHRA